MIIVEFILSLYTLFVLGTTSLIEALTGLHPREQLAYIQELRGLPDGTGFAGVLSSGGDR